MFGMKKNRILRPAVLVALVLTAGLPGDVHGQLNLNRMQADKAYESGEHYRAMQMYKELLDGHPNDPELNYNVGNALYKLNLPNEALSFFQRALANANDDRLRADIEYNLANALFKAGKLPESIEGYKQVLRERPDDEDARFNLEYAMKRMDKEKPPPQRNDREQENRDKGRSGSNENKPDDDHRSKESNRPRDEQDRNEQANNNQSQALSRRDAERILDALKHQEKEYHKKRVKEKAQAEVQSEKDW